jgi:hypothetical protein
MAKKGKKGRGSNEQEKKKAKRVSLSMLAAVDPPVMQFTASGTAGEFILNVNVIISFSANEEPSNDPPQLTVTRVSTGAAETLPMIRSGGDSWRCGPISQIGGAPIRTGETFHCVVTAKYALRITDLRTSASTAKTAS